MQITRKQLAREWLILAGCVVGSLIAGVGIALITGKLDTVGDEERFFKKDLLGIILLGLGLYCVVQIVRSIAWAIDTLKNKG